MWSEIPNPTVIVKAQTVRQSATPNNIAPMQNLLDLVHHRTVAQPIVFRWDADHQMLDLSEPFAGFVQPRFHPEGLPNRPLVLTDRTRRLVAAVLEPFIRDFIPVVLPMNRNEIVQIDS